MEIVAFFTSAQGTTSEVYSSLSSMTLTDMLLSSYNHHLLKHHGVFISKMACFADFPVEKASAFDRQEFLSRM
jgi:hypothetical protein